MKKWIVIALLFIFSALQAQDVIYIPDRNQVILDPGAFESFTKSVSWVPTKEETHVALLNIYNYLQHFDAQKNAGVDPQDVKRILGIFSSYKVQFLGILNKNNSRYILCNFFVDSISYYKRWESEFVLTEGRGYLSWRVTIDSEKQEIKFIHVN